MAEAEWESDYRYEATPLFEQILVCFPFSIYKNSHLETGNKIIMPQSSLSQITSAGIPYPLFFKIRNFNNDIVSHCGVLEFGADEGCVYFPEWMMKNLKIKEGDLVMLSNAALSKGGFMKLQPHAAAFAEVSDPRAVLERTMRDFTCLTKGDTFRVKYNERDFDFDVLQVSPGDAVSLIDTDCIVDFAPPLDYKEEEIVKKKEDEKKKLKRIDENEELDEKEFVKKTKLKKIDGGGVGDEKELEGKKFRPFMGRAWRLDGEVTAENGGASAVGVEDLSKVVIDQGKKREKDGGKEERKDERFKAFTGKGHVLGRE